MSRIANYRRSFDRLLSDPAFIAGLIALVTLLAGGLRFFRLEEWSFWVDEGFSLRDIAALGETRPLLSKFHFLYYVLSIPIIDSLGVSEFSARLLPAVVGTLSIPLMFVFAKYMFDTKVALLASVLLAISPWHIYWSQNARFYSLLLLLYTAALMIAYIGIVQGRISYMLGSSALAGLALVTHPTAAFFVLIVAIYILLLNVLSWEHSPQPKLRLLLSLALLPLLFILYEGVRVGAGELSAPEVLQPFFEGQPSIHGNRLLAGVGYYIGVALVCSAIIGGVFLISRKDHRGLFLVLSVIIPLPVLFVPTSFPRYVFLSLPSWILLGSVAVIEIYNRLLRKEGILAAALLLIALIDPLSQDILYYGYQNGNRSDWKGAFELVITNRLENDLVATTWRELGEFYLSEDVLLVSELDPDSFRESKERIWVVADGWINSELHEWLRRNANLVDNLDVYLPGRTLELNVFLYDPFGASILDGNEAGQDHLYIDSKQ